MTDVMALNVGPAYATNSDGSISEVYSPPRVVPYAERAGFAPGISMDLTTADAEGRPWDFSKAECRAAARKLVKEQRPLLLIGSPMCTAWRTWRALSVVKRPRDVLVQELEKARRHLKFAISLYREQTVPSTHLTLPPISSV